MLPVNSKSLFSMICTTIEKVDRGEVDVATANAISKLMAQANNFLRYELQRGILMTNPEFRENHRNIEIKTFDSLPE